MMGFEAPDTPVAEIREYDDEVIEESVENMGGREEAEDAVLGAATHVLPGMVDGDEWPVYYDHCFLRIMYDCAVGAKWDTVVDGSFVDNATDRQIVLAMIVGAMMAMGGAEKAHRLNSLSLYYRGELASDSRYPTPDGWAQDGDA